ncbi:MAG TPA: hypothetical protein PK677_12500, partial [Acidiphilium sp.]|nr:hypothetical protein [Acidiphilium sp.]
STQATKLFRKHHGSFNKSKFDAVSLIPKVPTAIANAKALDDRPKLRWPIKTGSRVYRLVESILTVNA